MNIKHYTKYLTFSLSFLLGLAMSLSSFQVASEDIDIFSVDQDQTVNKPNVLIILDNSANWSRQAQQWPGGLSQGQAEVKAISDVIDSLELNSVNVGLMEYRTQGSSTDSDNAFIRYHIRPMNADNKDALRSILYGTGATPSTSSIYSNINSPQEKRNIGNPFGNLFWETYNYLSNGNSVVAGAGTPASADTAAYNSNYDQYRSPLAATDTCTRTIVIFIANNTQSGPSPDSTANVNALAALNGGTAPDQLPFAEYTVTTNQITAPQGHTNACYPSLAACTSAENALCVAPDSGMDSCACTDDPAFSAPIACGTTTQFTLYGSQDSWTDSGTPATTVYGPSFESTGEATKCQNNDPNPYTCPGDSIAYIPDGPNQRKKQVTSWSPQSPSTSCEYVATPNSCGNNNNKDTWTPKGVKTITETIETNSPTLTDLGLQACSIDAASCDTSSCDSDPTYDSCFCSTPSDASSCTGSTTSKYEVLGTYTSTEALPTGNFVPAPAGPFMMDEWAQYLRNVGVPIPGTSPVVNSQVTTYTIDVFNKQQHEDHSALLFNAARVGGGKYFQAKNEDQIRNALTQIFTEVQAVNTAFSSASLPVNATNRAQNENQVFIGLFRPDREKKPLWFGNMKRYQLIKNGPNIELGDKNGDPAINDITGFITDCAVSFWTTTNGDYWSYANTDSPAAVGECGLIADSEHDDLPDGPFVEKGAVSEVLRKGNDPGATPDGLGRPGDGNYVLNRNLETLVASSPDGLGAFNISNSGGAFDSGILDDVNTVKFIRGEDLKDDDSDSSQTEPRSTIHGDVIHSRPQPINYGGTTGVVVFYGSNDGTFRAVNATTGVEMWSFIAPEHFSKLRRLQQNTPNIKFSGDSAPNTPKDYFFDGSTGIYQTFNASHEADRVWIYPSMRRGGRMIYAFDVTDPADPDYMWKFGCPNADNDLNCVPATTGVTDAGQSWSQPSLATIAGYDPTKPVVIIGGGYDDCEKDNTTGTPACASAKGSGVFVIDAETGSLIRHFDFNARSVVADVALIDIDFDQKVDFAYAADMGGNIYRMDFVNSSFSPITTPSTWPHSRIAHTDGDNRKFLFAPALLRATPTKTYVAIGSGDREHPLLSDYPVTTPVVNRFYVFKDDLTDADPTTDIDLDDTTVMTDFTDPSISNCANPGIQPTSPESGWFIDLNDNGPGEQVVTSAVIASGAVIFSTNRATPPSTTACTNSLGEARGYIVSLLNGSGAIGVTGNCGGTRSSEFVGGGLPPSPVMSTVPIDGVIHTVVIGAPQKDGSVSSSIEAQEVTVNIPSRRRPVYWFKTGDID